MNDRFSSRPLTLSIAAVERDTGLSKDTLRMWERRYGFPVPDRDALGERTYPLAQVEKLRLVKRLLDAGHRPGRIVPLPAEHLQRLCESTLDVPGPVEPASWAQRDLRPYTEAMRAHDVAGLRWLLAQTLSRDGLAKFVCELVVPLNAAVGDAWMRGQMEVFEEHMYTESVQIVLRQALAVIREGGPGARPRVLLTTFPGEPHGLGLLMAECMLVIDGCSCVSLGMQTPVWDIVLASQAYGADVVALGFSGSMNPHQIVEGLTELRAKLPQSVALWVGGSAPVLHRRTIDGVLPLASLDEIPAMLRSWRQAR